MSVFIQCTTIRIQIPIVIALFKIIQKLKLNPKHELNINSVKGSSLIYFTYSRYWSFRWLKISDPNFRRVEPFDIKHRIFESSFKSEYSKDQSFRWLKIFEESEFSEGQIFRASNFRVIDYVRILLTDHYWTLIISMKKVPIGKSVLFILHCFPQALLTTRWRYRLQMMILFIIMIIITNRIHRLIDMQLFHPK